MEESILYGVFRTGLSDKVALEHRSEELKERAGDSSRKGSRQWQRFWDHCGLGMSKEQRDGQQAWSKRAWRDSSSHEARGIMRAHDMEDPTGHGMDGRWEAMEGL